jgi:ketosteroid isomerase-like protein
MTNLQLIQHLYTAFAARDTATLLQLFHPDIEWIQNDGFPNGGRHVGAATVLDDVFAKFRTDWSAWQAPVHQYLDAGDTIIALGEYRGTHKQTNKPMTAAFAHVYDVKDGRITRFRQYTDTAQIRAAMTP